MLNKLSKLISLTTAMVMSVTMTAIMPETVVNTEALEEPAAVTVPVEVDNDEWKKYSYLNAYQFDKMLFANPTLINFEDDYSKSYTYFPVGTMFKDDVIINGDSKIVNGNICYEDKTGKTVVFGDLSVIDYLVYNLRNAQGIIICTGNLNAETDARIYNAIHNPHSPSLFFDEYHDTMDQQNNLVIYCDAVTGPNRLIEADIYCFGDDSTSTFKNCRINGNLISEGKIEFDSSVTINGDLYVDEINCRGSLTVTGNLIIPNEEMTNLNGVTILGEIIDKDAPSRDHPELSDETLAQLRTMGNSEIITDNSLFSNKAFYSDLYNKHLDLENSDYFDYMVNKGLFDYDSFLESREFLDEAFENETPVSWSPESVYRFHDEHPEFKLFQHSFILHEHSSKIYVDPQTLERDIYIMFPDNFLMENSIIVVNDKGPYKCHFLIGKKSASFLNSMIITQTLYESAKESGKLKVSSENSNINIYYHVPDTCSLSIMESNICGHAKNIIFDQVMTQNYIPFYDVEVYYDDFNLTRNSSVLPAFWIGSVNSTSKPDSSGISGRICGSYMYVSDKAGEEYMCYPGKQVCFKFDTEFFKNKKIQKVQHDIYYYEMGEWNFDSGEVTSPDIFPLIGDGEFFVPSDVLMDHLSVFRFVSEDGTIYKSVPLQFFRTDFCITNQPAHAEVNENEEASFSVGAVGYNLAYQWQYSEDSGTTWKNVSSGGNDTKYTIKTSLENNGWMFRCAVTNESPDVSETLESDPASLIVNEFKITGQPKSVSALEEDTVKFKTAASGTGLNYQWQVSEDNGKTWTDIKNDKTAVTSEYSLKASRKNNGYQYRCIVSTLAESKTSETAVLDVEKKFLWGLDNWNFDNTVDYFTGKTYREQMNDEYLEMLNKSLTNSEYKAVFVGRMNAQNDYIAALDEEWGGSCFGMSALSVLSFHDMLPFGKYKENASSLFELDVPKDNNLVSSLVAYYQMLQYKDSVSQQVNMLKGKSNGQYIEAIKQGIDENGVVLVAFRKEGWGSHAVLAYDYKEDKNDIIDGFNGCIYICDPFDSRKRTENNGQYNIYYETESHRWKIPAYDTDHVSSEFGAKFNFISGEIKTVNNGGYLEGEGQVFIEDYIARLDIVSGVDIEHKDVVKADKTDNGNYMMMGSDDSIVADYFYSMNNDDSNSGDKKSISGYLLKDAKSSYIITPSESNDLYLSLKYQDCVLEGNSSAAKKVTFDKDGYVRIEGEKSDYSIEMTFDKDYPTDWYTISVSGSGADTAVIEKAEEGYVLTSDNLKNVKVAANNRKDKASVNFSTEYSRVLVYEINKTTIGIKADTDNDGVFDKVISAENNNEEPQNPQTPPSSSPTENPDNHIAGDVNNDGFINVSDLIILKMHFSGVNLNSRTEYLDVNGDGVINSIDMVTIVQIILQLV